MFKRTLILASPVLFIGAVVLWLSSCDDKVRYYQEPRCMIASEKEKLADWTLRCIERGNPMSDEEGEDLVEQCEESGVRIVCPLKCIKTVTKRPSGLTDRYVIPCDQYEKEHQP